MQLPDDAGVNTVSTSVLIPDVISPWCTSKRKRALDFLLATALIVLSSPLLLLLGMIVKLSSPGPVFFRQVRLGKDGKAVTILKFRTMFSDRRLGGAGITSKDDPRVTSVGAVLRRWKLDELPQFLHVFCGQMSLVGPRPDLPEFLTRLPSTQMKLVLSVRPGITSAASLRFRDEEEVVGSRAGDEAAEFYVNVLLPKKVALDTTYLKGATFLQDCRLMWSTIWAVLHPGAAAILIGSLR